MFRRGWRQSAARSGRGAGGSLEIPASCRAQTRAGRGARRGSANLERETGFEPATLSLEG